MDPDAVLDVAVAAWHREGPEVSLNAICQRAGVSKPSVYREFGSEDGLTTAAIERYADALLAQLRTMLLADRPFRDTLAALADFVSHDPFFDCGCLFVKMRGASAQLGPGTQAAVRAAEARTLALYAEFITAHRPRDGGADALPAERAALYLHEQIGLALAQRARDVASSEVHALLTLALGVLAR